MPKPITAGPGTPTDQTASAPRTETSHSDVATADKQTTQHTVDDDLMSALGIPKDVQAQITAADRVKEQSSHAASEAATVSELQPEITPQGEPAQQQGGEQDAPPAEDGKDAAPPQQQIADTLDDEGDDDEDEPDPTAQLDEGVQAPKIDKRQKRINRLTRQRNELRAKTEALEAQLEKAAGKGEPKPAIPSVSTRLRYITDENQLNAEIGRAEAVVDWCDTHPTDISEQQIDPKLKETFDKGEITLEDAKAKTVAGWKGEAQKVLLSAPTRRDEVRIYAQNRGFFDNVAQQAWPELFDKRTPEYQLKNAILDDPAYSHLRGTAQENYAVGIAIEGMKSLQARVQAQGNGNGGTPRRGVATGDIDPRAFAPRVPIAPTTADTPLRDAREAGAVSSQRKVDDATRALVNDVDGSASSLAALLAAEEEVAGTTTGTAKQRQPVKV